MNLFSRSFLFATTLTFLALPGCGGGTSSTSEGANSFTGLDSKRAISSLTPDESTQLCESSRNFITEVLISDSFCTWAAVVASVEESPPASEEVCQLLVSVCSDTMEQMENRLNSEVKCEPNSREQNACDAPVSLFESCFSELRNGLFSIFDQASCADMDPNLREEFNGFLGSGPNSSTPKCLELEQRCPGAFF